jgi:hypothetical protein
MKYFILTLLILLKLSASHFEISTSWNGEIYSDKYILSQIKDKNTIERSLSFGWIYLKPTVREMCLDLTIYIEEEYVSLTQDLAFFPLKKGQSVQNYAGYDLNIILPSVKKIKVISQKANKSILVIKFIIQNIKYKLSIQLYFEDLVPLETVINRISQLYVNKPYLNYLQSYLILKRYELLKYFNKDFLDFIEFAGDLKEWEEKPLSEFAKKALDFLKTRKAAIETNFNKDTLEHLRKELTLYTDEEGRITEKLLELEDFSPFAKDIKLKIPRKPMQLLNLDKYRLYIYHCSKLDYFKESLTLYKEYESLKDVDPVSERFLGNVLQALKGVYSKLEAHCKLKLAKLNKFLPAEVAGYDFLEHPENYENLKEWLLEKMENSTVSTVSKTVSKIPAALHLKLQRVTSDAIKDVGQLSARLSNRLTSPRIIEKV